MKVIKAIHEQTLLFIGVRSSVFLLDSTSPLYKFLYLLGTPDSFCTLESFSGSDLVGNSDSIGMSNLDSGSDSPPNFFNFTRIAAATTKRTMIIVIVVFLLIQ